MVGTRQMRGWVSALVVLGLSVPSVARAQAHDAAAAEALFVEGKRLMQKQDYANACPKLAESQRIDPASGTVFALALCYEGAGMIATAWATFNDALAEAKRSQRPDRAKAAEDHLRALEARMTRLRIDVPSPAPGIEVTRNGAAVGKVLWSTAIPVDPGMYTFEAHAPGRVPWKFSVNVDKPGELFSPRPLRSWFPCRLRRSLPSRLSSWSRLLARVPCMRRGRTWSPRSASGSRGAPSSSAP